MSLLPNNKSTAEVVRKFEDWALTQPQITIETTHHFHAGCYARTIMIPKDSIITGVEYAVPTILIVSGNVHINNTQFVGYHVLEGMAGRKNLFAAVEDTHLTMIFATDKNTVEDVEEEFTREAHKLGSRREV